MIARSGSLLALLLAGCTGCATVAPPPTTTFVVVRHAEKAADDPRDPALSDAGRARARRLAARLADDDVVAAYATAYRRTQQTVRPTADAHGVAVTVYDAAAAPGPWVETLRATHPRGTVLIAGHSNTVPAILAALCACTVAPMTEDQYDRIGIVRYGADGRATLELVQDAATIP